MKQIHINKSAFMLVGTMLVLMISSLFLIGKFIPFLTHTFYYCESIVRSLSWQLPKGFLIFFTTSGILLISISIVKIFFVTAHAAQLKKKIVRYAFTKGQKLILSRLKLADIVFVISDTKPYAFCFGLFQPKIYISNTLLKILSLEEFETILRHEQYHLHHKDTFIMIVIYSIQHFFLFFPLLSDLIRNYRIERELNADQAAIQGRGEKKTLVSVLKKLLQYDHTAFAFAPALADEDTINARIQALINNNYYFHSFQLGHIIISIVSVGLLGSLFFIPVQASETQITDTAMMRCYYSNEKNFTPSLNKSVPYSPAR